MEANICTNVYNHEKFRQLQERHNVLPEEDKWHYMREMWNFERCLLGISFEVKRERCKKYPLYYIYIREMDDDVRLEARYETMKDAMSARDTILSHIKNFKKSE